MALLDFPTHGRAAGGGEVGMILIDMDMPDCCAHCPCCEYDDVMDEVSCNLASSELPDTMLFIPYNEASKHRHEACPLKAQEPRGEAHWVHCNGKSNLWYCSVCGEKIIYNPTRKTYKPDKKPVWEINKYCRNCGALMKAGGEDEST